MTLLAGAPVASMRRRLKLASVLYDRVLIEEGVWDATAGPDGSFTFWNPDDGSAAWQTARSRRARQSSEAVVLIGPAESPSHTALKTLATIGWRATFEPFKRELPREAHEWFTFGHANDSSDAKRIASQLRYRDRESVELKRMLPANGGPFGFVRDRVIDDANLDLLLGAGLGSAVSLDSLHASVVRARVERGEAHPAFGSNSLPILVPNVANLEWDDISDLRRQSGLRDFRALIAEIEAAAWDASTSPASFAALVHQEFESRLRVAQDRVAGSVGRTIAAASVGFVVGEAVPLAFGIPVVGGLVGGAAGIVVDVALRRPPRWLAADMAVRRRLRPDAPTGRRVLAT